MLRILALSAIAVSLAHGPLFADPPDVLGVTVEKTGMDWRISVTLRHPDTGWDHYADGWEVLDSEGNRLGHRELMHPHVGEQAFTRSLSRVYIPDGTMRIYIRTKCSVDGWSETTHGVDFRN